MTGSNFLVLPSDCHIPPSNSFSLSSFQTSILFIHPLHLHAYDLFIATSVDSPSPHHPPTFRSLETSLDRKHLVTDRRARCLRLLTGRVVLQ